VEDKMKENDIAGILTSTQTIALVGRATNRIAQLSGDEIPS
jgi:predicted CoA-binding protein